MTPTYTPQPHDSAPPHICTRYSVTWDVWASGECRSRTQRLSPSCSSMPPHPGQLSAATATSIVGSVSSVYRRRLSVAERSNARLSPRTPGRDPLALWRKAPPGACPLAALRRICLRSSSFVSRQTLDLVLQALDLGDQIVVFTGSVVFVSYTWPKYFEYAQPTCNATAEVANQLPRMHGGWTSFVGVQRAAAPDSISARPSHRLIKHVGDASLIMIDGEIDFLSGRWVTPVSSASCRQRPYSKGHR